MLKVGDISETYLLFYYEFFFKSFFHEKSEMFLDSLTMHKYTHMY